MNDIKKDLIYLLACAVNDTAPDAEKVKAMDIEKLYSLCKAHTVRAAVYVPLEKAGAADEKFIQAYNKAVRKNILLDSEREAITAEFECHGIWYLPLKGVILKELYPRGGMREMSDNDILYDPAFQNEVRDIMLARGYTAERVGKAADDIYMKPPVMNFEMHTRLFSYDTKKLYDYYQDPGRLLKTDEGRKYGCRLSDEDFYVYVTAHEYKHYSCGGTGIRSLLDCYVFMKAKGSSIDRGYISEQMKELGIEEYEQERLALAMKLFSSPGIPDLTETEEKLLDSFLDYGTYGTRSNAADNALKKYEKQSGKSSKAGFVRARLFPDHDYMKHIYPRLCRYKALVPVGYVCRWVKGIIVNHQKIAAEVKALKKHDKE